MAEVLSHIIVPANVRLHILIPVRYIRPDAEARMNIKTLDFQFRKQTEGFQLDVYTRDNARLLIASLSCATLAK